MDGPIGPSLSHVAVIDGQGRVRDEALCAEII